MVIMDLFKEEQKITLIFKKQNSMVEMICVIDKIFDDRLELRLPQYFMRYINYLQVGNKITAKAFSKLGTIDFNTIIMSSPLEDSFVIELDYNSLKLTPGNELPKIQAIEHLELYSGERQINAKTFEITSDYIKFTTSENFKLDDTLDAKIKLSKNYGIINFTGVITEIDEVYDNEFTLHFSTITEHDKQALLYYMYMYTKDID